MLKGKSETGLHKTKLMLHICYLLTLMLLQGEKVVEEEQDGVDEADGL